ncbi:AraC family transcriptional regulator [Sabulicella rubraurantiaca]|uniref:AraC family transcriptional regulator n=1 Tax=Sabulicella rubraurantiaca TaxID=2811429 RepID=UPI001A96A20D|nr:AraC family transcriptional regulator [Sabulicella rubraurantiaca]
MLVPTLSFDFDQLSLFNVVRVSDPSDLDTRSRVSDRLPGSSRDYRYQLLDRTLWRMRCNTPILSVAIRSAGPILASFGENRFATEVSVRDDKCDVFGFSTPLQGSMALIRRGDPATATSSSGLAYRLGPDARLVTSDGSKRTNVFIKVATVEEVLEQMLGKRLRTPLEFEPTVDWSKGLAASLKAQLDFILNEFARPDGIAGNAVALASTTDLLMTLILRGLPHNHTGQLALEPGYAVPAYVQRAEDFMRAHAACPIHLTDVAAAAGCSVRTLGVVFQRFRGQTPLTALHAFRLEQVYAELRRGTDAKTIGVIARRYGFTNASRFTVAFRRRFGETPLELLRRSSDP